MKVLLPRKNLILRKKNGSISFKILFSNFKNILTIQNKLYVDCFYRNTFSIMYPSCIS